VFSASVRDNITLARTEATDATILAALHAVGANGWIEALPRDVATMVGGHGVQLDPRHSRPDFFLRPTSTRQYQREGPPAGSLYGLRLCYVVGSNAAWWPLERMRWRSREHVWRHTRRGDKYVTVIIDLTGIRDGTRPARLLDMVEDRSKQAFKTWLAERPKAWRDRVEVVAMDGSTGFRTATAEELPDAIAVMDPFHVVRLAGEALDQCRRRIQQGIHGHRGRKDDPLYRARGTLQTGADLLTDKQKDRLADLFDAESHGDTHVEVEATWRIYQRMIAAYREPDRKLGKELMEKLIDSLSAGVPAALTELVTLRRTLKKRADDVLAYFDRPGTSNGPTEAINGRLEHLRGSALGFRNLTNYTARSLLETGGFRPRLHPRL
jgi:transposase